MERVSYHQSLDVHRSGVQFLLRGFQTADKFSRRVVLGLTASGETVALPQQLEAVVYVTMPRSEEQSIEVCEILGDTLIYDMPPIPTEGTAKVQIKLIETGAEGAKSVLAVPTFAIEVSKSEADDESVEATAVYTALEDAVAKAKAVYDSRLLRIALDADCVFCAYYADGTVYESDVLKELFLGGDALLAKSYARGETGVRDEEDTDNAMYYATVAKNGAEEAQSMMGSAEAILSEVKRHGVYTAFTMDFETGHLLYSSPKYTFTVNPINGNLETETQSYTFEQSIGVFANDWFLDHGVDVQKLQATAENHEKEIAEMQTTAEEQGAGIAELKERNDKFCVINRLLCSPNSKSATNVLAMSPSKKYICKLVSESKTEIKIRLVRTDDLQSGVATITIACTEDSPGGFPRVEMDDDTIAVCWRYISVNGTSFHHKDEIGGSNNARGYADLEFNLNVKYRDVYQWRFFRYTDSAVEEVIPSGFDVGNFVRLPMKYPWVRNGESGKNAFWFMTEEYRGTVATSNNKDERTMVLYELDKASNQIAEVKTWAYETPTEEKLLQYKFYRSGDKVTVIYPDANGTICVDRMSYNDAGESVERLCRISSDTAVAWAVDTVNENVVTIGTDGCRVFDYNGTEKKKSAALKWSTAQTMEVLDGVLFAGALVRELSDLQSKSKVTASYAAKSNGIGFGSTVSVFAKEIVEGGYVTEIETPILESTNIIMVGDLKWMEFGGWVVA